MENIKEQCPTFPHFGARYPDAQCIDGYLWDLDRVNDEGLLCGGGDDPCPFCNKSEYLEWLPDDWTDAEKEIHHESLCEKHLK